MSTHDSELRHDTPENLDHLQRAKHLWETLLTETLCVEFTGEAWLRLKIERGVIQKVTAHQRRRSI